MGAGDGPAGPAALRVLPGGHGGHAAPAAWRAAEGPRRRLAGHAAGAARELRGRLPRPGARDRPGIAVVAHAGQRGLHRAGVVRHARERHVESLPWTPTGPWWTSAISGSSWTGRSPRTRCAAFCRPAA